MCDATPETGPRARHVITGTPTGKGQDSAGAVEAEQLIEDQAGPLERSVSRYDAGVFDVERPLVRLRIERRVAHTHHDKKRGGGGGAPPHMRRRDSAAPRLSTSGAQTGCGLVWAGKTKARLYRGGRTASSRSGSSGTCGGGPPRPPTPELHCAPLPCSSGRARPTRR